MKKLLFLLASLFIISACTPDEDNLKFHMEFVPVVSVQVPEYVTPGQVYDIKVAFKRPTDCHYFDGFYYEVQNTTRIVAVQTIVIQDSSCEPLSGEDLDMESFRFVCDQGYASLNSSYTFKFYKGEDDNGNQLFEEVVVPIGQ